MSSETKEVPLSAIPETPIRPGDHFAIGDIEYHMDIFGVIHQDTHLKMPTYDVNYVAKRYDSIPESVLNISFLRAGFVLAGCGPVLKVLDVGYGNGGYLKAMKLTGAYCAGTDVSSYPVPEGCDAITWGRATRNQWDVVSFFDSLEHFPELGVIGNLTTRFIVITVPCVKNDVTVEWFGSWKHLRPGEHLHHFSAASLALWMGRMGYDPRVISHPEDAVRGTNGFFPNTVTGIFERRRS